ncbi:MAG: GNAT family N-acetyltransferase [Blautia sp.]|nr:GNAT family N-acetyltransferase [Blautia sp.]
MLGTIQLKTERLVLRKHLPEDAAILYRDFGSDEAMYRYSGWNPYASLEMAESTVRNFMEQYTDANFYGWAIEKDGQLIGTIGAYDYDPVRNCIETGMSIARPFWGHGYAGEALGVVLEYLTEKEKIQVVTAWCASDNIGSIKAMEKAGMKLIGKEHCALKICGRTYDKLFYEYRSGH